MTYLDQRGLELSTISAAAAEHYCEGLDLFLSAWPGSEHAFDKATAADPDFALANAARARLHALRGEMPEAKAKIRKAVVLSERHGTLREKSHTSVLSLAVHGRSPEALSGAVAHLASWPTDALVMSLTLGAFGLFAFSGMRNHNQARVDLVERHAGSFSNDDWWFLTYRGWSHIENGAVALGRGLTERGLFLRRENANGAHALAHAMFEQGLGTEAESLISDWLPLYDRSGILHGHIAWHAALSALERDDPAEAIAIYEKDIQPSVTMGLPINVITDCVSFLWRLRTYGYAVPSGLWESAETYSSNHFPNPGFSFADTHMGLLAAATGNKAAAQQRIAGLESLLEKGSFAAGPAAAAVCRAALMFVEEKYIDCVDLLEPVLADVACIGGSNAQREVIEDTLLQALMRSGESSRAKGLLERRLHRRPSPKDSKWRNIVIQRISEVKPC